MERPSPSPGRNRILIGLAFAACFLVVGVPYWAIPYAQVSLPGTLMGLELLIVPAAAFALRFPLRVPFLPAAATPGLAVPAAVLARVAWEVVQDPTSHNLWPFEAVLAALLGFGVALAGVVPASLILLPGRRRGR
jgi:hypothetical protein